jgi:hypothetical protein
MGETASQPAPAYHLYDAMEAYRLPAYLAMALERVAMAGARGASVAEDCRLAIAYLTRLRQCRIDRLRPHRVPLRIVRRLPPAEVAVAVVRGWQFQDERRRAALAILAAQCPAGSFPGSKSGSWPVGDEAAALAVDILARIVGREPAGRRNSVPAVGRPG